MRVRWNLDRDVPLYKPRFNIAPETSPNIPVIVRQKGANECRLMHWGLIPHWTADPSIGNRMIDARAETLTELLSFKLLVDRRRCIIPADGFYERRKEGKRKVPILCKRRIHCVAETKCLFERGRKFKLSSGLSSRKLAA
jgi:putative SOS response-associated peptidase YedK